MIYALTIGGQTKRSTLGQHEVELDWDKMPDASKDFIIRYGMRQFLADAMAGAENEGDAKAKVAARADKLRSGDLTRTRGEGKTVDSVEVRALKNAKAAIRAQVKAKNLTVTKEQVEAAAKAALEKDEKWLVEAKRELDLEAKQSQGIDLAALGITI